MIRLGQRLRDERIKKGLSLEQVSKQTKIRSSFLTALENGEYNKLPSSAYAQGFVRNYAQFLGLAEREMLALFRREFDEEKYFRVLPEGLTKQTDFPLRKVGAGQFFLGGAVVLALAFYLLFQYRSAFFGPSLSVRIPNEGAVISTPVTVSGDTDADATVTVNDAGVAVDSNGRYTKKIDVFPGKETVVVKAENRFGKKKVVERHITVK